MTLTMTYVPSSETQGQIKGARESLNGRKNIYGTKKSKERREESLGIISYQTSSKRPPPFWLLIGARNLVFFYVSWTSGRLYADDVLNIYIYLICFLAVLFETRSLLSFLMVMREIDKGSLSVPEACWKQLENSDRPARSICNNQ